MFSLGTPTQGTGLSDYTTRAESIPVYQALQASPVGGSLDQETSNLLTQTKLAGYLSSSDGRPRSPP